MKRTRLFITGILTATMLSACSTAENSVDPQKTATGTSSEHPTEQQNSGASQQNNSTKPVEDNTSEQNITLSYTISEQTFKKQFELVHSSQQDFSIQLTDQFFLIEEEPGMDAVVYKDNEAIMMRVEVLSDNSWTYEDALENSKSILLASSKDHHYSSFELPNNIKTESFTQVDSFIVENESDKMVLLLGQLDDKIIRLTIFDDYVTNVLEAFLIQGMTIQ